MSETDEIENLGRNFTVFLRQETEEEWIALWEGPWSDRPAGEFVGSKDESFEWAKQRSDKILIFSESREDYIPLEGYSDDDYIPASEYYKKFRERKALRRKQFWG